MRLGLRLWQRMLEFLFLFSCLFLLCLRQLVYFLLCLLKSWTNITLFTLVLLRSLGGVIFAMVVFHYSILPFVTKRGSNFYFWTGNVQRGSLLVCTWPHSDWTKSFVCKDAFHMDSTIQKCSRDSALFTSQRFWFPASRPDDVSSHLSIVPAVRTLDRQSIIRMDDVNFRPDPPLYREAFVPACIRSDVSAVRPNDSQ